ncbi:MAG: solute carrier family 23 protein [Lactobacillus johnsonii]|nr:solute carrier family 23 protein [Lactobacillus johnsonii]MDY6196318.1 solute carrier family 23 protein [Lactobacillus johnsonii]
MDNSNMKYNVRDLPKKWWEWLLYPLQILLSVFVATILIANICGTPISSCLLGACLGTLVYQIITKFRSPVFISSCGATVSAVCGALALNAAGNNYLMVFCGGLIILAVYGIFALIVKLTGIKWIDKIFPPTIIGAVTIVIGINLAAFINGYTQVGGAHSDIGILIAIATMLITAVVSHYGKGFMKNIPFLFGIVGGYIIALIFTWCGIKVVDFSSFNNMQWYPDLTFLKWQSSDWSWANLGRTCLFFVPVAICALLEHVSDHKVLSNIIGQDLINDPGLHRTLFGDGVASALGTLTCGLPNTSYGESIATIGFSRVASVWVTSVAAILLGLMSFIGPVSAFIQSIPSCVFGGCAMILYGFIAASGLKTIINNKVDLNNNKNLTVICVILTVGVSGIWLFDAAFSGVALAMILGVVLNLILREKEPKIN